MYINISPQKMGVKYQKSAANFVAYLEKENNETALASCEHFFSQYEDSVSSNEVSTRIDANTSNLHKNHPKFYTITINPSQKELAHLTKHSSNLKDYVRELMKHYAASFNREIYGRKVTVDDLVYFAKIEHKRTFKRTDKAVLENRPIVAEIKQLKQEIKKIESGELTGNIARYRLKIKELEESIPYRQNGQIIVQGMEKEGIQTHVHIIMSRKDATNKHSISPGSKQIASEVFLNGKLIKVGFHRDGFVAKAELCFDTMFQYRRNYAEHYQARKTFIKDPHLYFSNIYKLSVQEKRKAFEIIRPLREKRIIPAISITESSTCPQSI